MCQRECVNISLDRVVGGYAAGNKLRVYAKKRTAAD